MPHPVLNEDWTEYDNRRIRDGRDRSKVSCEEAWEVDYIVKKLKKHYPYKTETAIKQANEACCRSVPAPRPRTTFIDCVTRRLDS